MRLLLSDNPVVVDVPETYDRLTELEGVAGDPLHIAMKMEEATNRRQNRISVDVRRCVRKFSQPLTMDNRTLEPVHSVLRCLSWAM